MIHEIDEALSTLVEDGLPDAEQLEISFEAPTSEWASRRNSPAVNLYLYDVRQDTNRNQFGRVIVRDESGRVTGQRRIPQWYRLAYLCTAWTQRPTDEHRLLSDLLRLLVPLDVIPPALLAGTSLEEVGTAVPLGVAMPPPQDRALSDIWSALGGDLKPSLDLVVTAPLLPDQIDEVGPPVTEEPILVTSGAADAGGALERTGGRGYPASWDHDRPPRRRPPVRVPADERTATEAFEALRDTFGRDDR